MGFHLQLYPPKFLDWTIVLLALFLPAAATAFVLHNLALFLVVPFGIIVLVFLLAVLPISESEKLRPESSPMSLRSISSEQKANGIGTMLRPLQLLMTDSN